MISILAYSILILAAATTPLPWFIVWRQRSTLKSWCGPSADWQTIDTFPHNQAFYHGDILLSDGQVVKIRNYIDYDRNGRIVFSFEGNLCIATHWARLPAPPKVTK